MDLEQTWSTAHKIGAPNACGTILFIYKNRWRLLSLEAIRSSVSPWVAKPRW